LRSFVSDAGDYAMKMVDPWLNILTQGNHSRTLKYVQEREAAKAERYRNRLHEKS
jgi:hypothetical protein